MTPQQIIDAWNAQADAYNQWYELSEDEKLAWAFKCASTRPEQEQCPSCGGFCKKSGCERADYVPPKQEPVAYDKAALNRFAQNLYAKKMLKGKHGHYESMFHVIHQCIKKVTKPQRELVWLTDEEIEAEFGYIDELLRNICYRTQARLKEKST